jgi:hypothetical protein
MVRSSRIASIDQVSADLDDQLDRIGLLRFAGIVSAV